MARTHVTKTTTVTTSTITRIVTPQNNAYIIQLGSLAMVAVLYIGNTFGILASGAEQFCPSHKIHFFRRKKVVQKNQLGQISRRFRI